MTVFTAVGASQIQSVPKTITLIDQKVLLDKLNEVDWDITNGFQCPNQIYNFIKNSFDTAYKQAMYNKKIGNSKRNKEKWINRKINTECEKRDTLFIQLKKDPTNRIIRYEYHKHRNKTNKLIENSRNTYYKNKINENKNNPRKLWQILNNLSGRIVKSVDEVLNKAFNIDQHNEKSIANQFAIQFGSDVQNIVPNCNITILNKNDIQKPINKSMFYKKASEEKILKIVNNISERKAPGQDCIRPVDIKNVGRKLVTAITNLINKSITSGIYPNELKIGVVRPIYKKGKYDCCSNYRPITILPILDKIFEKYIAGIIHQFFENNNVLTNRQFGFRRNKSTTLLLSEFTDEVNRYLDQKKHVVLVLIDYSKAFDTLRHDDLIVKLNDSGIRGPMLKWCKDYLHKRNYKVKIGNSYSDNVNVTIGTAQGSVLGPLHYLVYVNDVTNVVQHSSLYQYADDTCLIVADNNLSNAMKKLQEDFTAICKWSHDAGLVLNAQKTVMMHIKSSHNTSDTVSVNLLSHCHQCLHSPVNNCTNCVPIEQVRQATYLGLIIDNRLNWGPHIEKICDKLRALLAKFNIIKYKVPYRILLNMYKALAASIISYGITSYGRTYKTHLEKIYTLQIRLLKVIVPTKVKQSYRGEYHNLFEYCKILPINEQVYLDILVEQLLLGKLDQLKPVQHKIQTRKITNKELDTISCTY